MSLRIKIVSLPSIKAISVYHTPDSKRTSASLHHVHASALKHVGEIVHMTPMPNVARAVQLIDCMPAMVHSCECALHFSYTHRPCHLELCRVPCWFAVFSFVYFVSACANRLKNTVCKGYIPMTTKCGHRLQFCLPELDCCRYALSTEDGLA